MFGTPEIDTSKEQMLFTINHDPTGDVHPELYHAAISEVLSLKEGKSATHFRKDEHKSLVTKTTRLPKR